MAWSPSRMGGAVILCAVVAYALLASPTAHGHIGLANHPYMYDSQEACDQPVDPLNFVWQGSGATTGRAANHTTFHTAEELGDEWGETQIEDEHVIFSHGECIDQGSAVASASSTESRFHIRYWRVPHKDDEGNQFTAGDAHYEDLTNDGDCGSGPFPSHAVRENGNWEPSPRHDYQYYYSANDNNSGFDWAREELASALLPEYPNWYEALTHFGYGLKAGTHHAVEFWYFWGNTRSFEQCDGDIASGDGVTAAFSLNERQGLHEESKRGESRTVGNDREDKLGAKPEETQADSEISGDVDAPFRNTVGDCPAGIHRMRFDLGKRFQGLELTHRREVCQGKDGAIRGLSGPRFVSAIYGDCDPQGHGCGYPIEVQVWPRCLRGRSSYSDPGPLAAHPHMRHTRGSRVGVLEAGNRLEIYLRDVTVVIFGTQGRREVMTAARQLRGADVPARTAIGQGPRIPGLC